jgi:protein ImuB
MLDARLFLKLLQLDLRAHPPAAPVMKVTLAAEPVKPRPGQGGLFLPATPPPDRLELTLARLAGIVGEEKIGAAEVLDTHHPDAFQMKRFALPQQGLKPAIKNGIGAARLKPCPDTNQVTPCPDTNQIMPSSDVGQIPQRLKPTDSRNTNAGLKACSTRSTVALRRFRPPLAATVELLDGEPVRIAAGEIQGEVASVSGPWRSSGDWWKGKTPPINTDQHGSNWTREEWDVALSNSNGIALYRIYRDLASEAWFLEGTYD